MQQILGSEKRRFRALPALITALVIGALGVYIWRSDLFADLDIRQIQPAWFVAVVLTQVVLYGLRGLLLALFVAQSGPKLDITEWYGLSITSTISNILLPFGGGVGVRAGYLKMAHNYPLTHFSALTAASGIVIFSVSGFTGLAAVLYAVLFRTQPMPWIVAGILLALAIGPLIVVALPVDRLPIPQSGRIGKALHSALDGWNLIRRDPALMTQQVLIVFGLQIGLATSLYCALRGLGLTVSLIDALLVAILTNSSTFIRITPNGVGIGEAVAGLSAQLVGFGAAEGIAAALVSRLGAWFLLLVLGPPFIYSLTQRLQSTASKGIQDEETVNATH